MEVRVTRGAGAGGEEMMASACMCVHERAATQSPPSGDDDGATDMTGEREGGEEEIRCANTHTHNMRSTRMLYTRKIVQSSNKRGRPCRPPLLTSAHTHTQTRAETVCDACRQARACVSVCFSASQCFFLLMQVEWSREGERDINGKS